MINNKNLNAKPCNDHTTTKNRSGITADKSGISVQPAIFSPHSSDYRATDYTLTCKDPEETDLTGNDSLINFTNDLLWSVNPGFKLIASNKAFIKGLKDFTGRTFEPGDNLLVKEIFPPEFLVFWETCYKEALTGKSFNKEVYTPATNKWAESWTDTSFNPIYKNDTIIGVACLSRNITERKLAEQKLQQSEARLIAAQEVAKVGSWETDLSTLDVIWSEETYRIFGINPADFEKSHPAFLDFVHPEDRVSVDAALVNSLKDDTINTIEHRILTPGGETRFVEERWRIFRNSQGQPLRAVGTCRDITEHKTYETALQKAYEEKNTVLESIDDGFFALDTNSVVTYWNKRAEILLDTKKEDLIGKNLHEVFTARGSRIFYDNYVKALKEKVTIRFEGFSTISKKWLAVSAYGSDNGLSVYFNDITGQKNAAEKVKESELRYRSIIEQATDAICIADSSMKIVDINPYGCQMLGYSREEFLLLSVTELFLPEDLKTNPFKIEELRSGKIIRNERRFIKKDGTVIEVEMSGRILEDGRFILFGHDIAERKKAEDKLKESELRYRSLNEQATDAICITDASMNFLNINAYACETFGYTEEEVLQLSLPDILFAEDLKDNPIKLHELKLGKTVRNERRLKRKDGTAINMEVSTKLMEDGSMIMFGHDVTERKKAERAIIESEVKYRSFFENSMDGLLITVTDGEILAANPAACAIFRMTEEEICKTGRFGLIDNTDPRVKILIDERRATGKAKGEITYKRKDGSKFPGEITSVVFKDAFGQERTSIIVRDLTEQVTAHKKIEASEKQYRQIVETAQEGIWVINENNKTIFVNRKMCEILEYSEQEMIGRTNLSFKDKKDKKRALQQLERRRKGVKETFEDTLITKSGRKIWVQFSTNPILGEDGAYIGALAMITDITEKKQIELSLRESNERYNIISNATNDMVWDWDLETNMVYRNKEGWKKIFGGSDKEIENGSVLDWDDRIHPEDQHKVKLTNDEILKSKKDFFEIECRVLRDDGSYAYVHDRGNVIRNEKGKAIRLIGATQDITARKEAELQVAKSELRFRSLVQNSSDLISILDEKAYYLFCSPAVKKILGYEPEFVVGKNAFSFIHPDDIITIKSDLAKEKPGKNFDVTPFRFKNKKGEWRWLESKITDMRDNPEVQGYVFNSRDVTERKMAEENLINTSAELKHALIEQVLLRKKTEESETRLKEAQAIAHLGHWHLDFSTQIALWSDEACRIYGLSPEENKQSYADWTSFIHPADVDQVMKLTAESQKTLSDTILNHRIVLKDGSVKYIASKSKFEFDENGKPAGIYGISHDVTESKIAEEEINKLSIIAQETVNAVIITNPLGEILWVNEAFTRITEFEPEEVLGKKPGDFLQGDETNLAVVRYMRNKLKNVEPFECDIINYARSGRKYWLRIQSQPQFDENGKLKYFFAIETDITKEKEAEEILRASEERYRYLFNNNPASIIIWDIESLNILEVNDTSVELYGYTRNEFLTKDILELRLPEHHDKVKQFAKTALQKHDFRSANKWKHLNKSGEEMFMDIASHRITYKGKPVILSLANNITEKVYLEKVLENERKLKLQEITAAVITAQEQERQELGSELHDNITQILAGSLLYLGLATKELNVEHPYLKETHSLINTAITELRNLSHALIPPSLNESELLNAINENIIKITQQASGIHISLQAAGFDETTIPDKLKLNIYRIVQEQFNNILKHAMAKNVVVHLKQDHEKTILSIKDDGVGFDTGKKGNGVGLMNIKTRASLFNGELTIISSPGKGCELRIVFN